jgi:hypothetical protein
MKDNTCGKCNINGGKGNTTFWFENLKETTLEVLIGE